MKLTKQWLKNKNACEKSYKWYLQQKTTDPDELFKRAIEEKRFSDINWVISRKLKRLDKIRYAIFSAECVIDIFEKKYPGDERPRKAIEAAKRYLESPTEKNKRAARAAARAARAANAAYAAYAARAAARAADAADAAYAAYAARVDAAAADAAAADAADAARAAAYVARAAYAADADAAAAAEKEMYIKVLNFGFELLKGKI